MGRMGRMGRKALKLSSLFEAFLTFTTFVRTFLPLVTDTLPALRRYADTPIRRYALPRRLAENTGFFETEIAGSTFLWRAENEVIKKLDLK